MLDPTGRWDASSRAYSHRQAMQGHVPYIMTIFNPLSVAKYLAGDELMRIHLRRHPEQLLAGLEIITEVMVAFVQEVIRAGAAGIF